jgi:hypothetical protein
MQRRRNALLNSQVAKHLDASDDRNKHAQDEVEGVSNR